MLTRDALADRVAEQIAAVLAIDVSSIDWDAPFAELGLSSLQAIELSDDLQRWTGLTLEPTLAYDHPTIDLLVTHVAAEATRTPRALAARGEDASR